MTNGERRISEKKLSAIGISLESGKKPGSNDPNWGSASGFPYTFSFAMVEAEKSTFDMRPVGLNNLPMPRPDAVRRVKSYSAATGYVYQYYFYEVEKVGKGDSSATEYVYMVSVDRHHVFPLKIVVMLNALQWWTAQSGQELSGTEEYAVAKMRLFQAFDEIPELSATTPKLIVDQTNLEALLLQLDL